MKAIQESQVRAANLLFNAVPSYKDTENALGALAPRLKDDDLNSCLLKTLAINGLLSTNIYDVLGMAKHVHNKLKNSDPRDGTTVVDLIANFNGKKHLSFASKYAHFFLDADRYPIYDQYVCRSIAHHRESKRVWPKDYVQFVDWFEKVRDLCELPFSTKEIDRYLWLTGMRRVWLTSEQSELGKDAIALFERKEPEIRSALAVLLGG